MDWKESIVIFWSLHGLPSLHFLNRMWFLACMQNSTPPGNDVIDDCQDVASCLLVLYHGKMVPCDILVSRSGIIQIYAFTFFNSMWFLTIQNSPPPIQGFAMWLLGVYHMKSVHWDTLVFRYGLIWNYTFTFSEYVFSLPCNAHWNHAGLLWVVAKVLRGIYCMKLFQYDILVSR